jgi:putative DNA primase/helicase
MSTTQDGSLPEIQVAGRQLPAIYDEAWEALLRKNDPPQLFVTNGRLSRPEPNGHGWRIRFLNEDIVNGMLARAAVWRQKRGRVSEPGRPPRDIARDFLVNPDLRLPELTAIATTPVFDANGRLLNRSGYYPDAALLMKLDDAWETLAVAAGPTVADVDAARDLLLNELLGDFPFKAPSDRAHAVAALVLPFVRAMIQGPTPLHYIGAPTVAAGKSLLADLVRIVTVGDNFGTTTLTTNEGDTRKKLTAVLRSGAQAIHIDNIVGGLRSAELAAAITAEVWGDRLLGTSDMVYLPNRALWIVTGTNLNLSLEIARRCLRIRLNPNCERPWERADFRHPDVRKWATDHRRQLVHAVLTVIQSWVAAGRPEGSRVRGSFESWAQVVGGIIEHLGLPGFLGDEAEFFAEADQESQEMAAFVAAWWQKHGTAKVKARALQKVAQEHDLLAHALEGKTPSARDSKFGRMLSALHERRFDDLVVVVAPGRTGSRDYRLRKADPRTALEVKGSA